MLHWVLDGLLYIRIQIVKNKFLESLHGEYNILVQICICIISTDEDPSLWIESYAVINLRGVSTNLNKQIVKISIQ